MTLDAQQALERAQKHERNGDDEAALGAYLDAIEAYPDNLEIAYLTARALLKVGFVEEARSQLRRIVFVEPTHLKAKASLGNCHFLLGDYDNAKLAFSEVLGETPDNQNALFGLASICLEEGQLQDARKLAERLLSLNPSSAPALTLIAETFAREPQSSQAAAAFRKAVTLDPNYTPALMGLARLALVRRQFSEAIDLATRVTRLDKSQAEPLQIIADAHLARQEFEEAREALTLALRRSGADQTDILLDLSAVCRKEGNQIEALRHAYEAWNKSGGSQAAGNALGAALKKLGLVAEARSVLTAVAKSEDLDPHIKSSVEQVLKAEDQKQERAAEAALKEKMASGEIDEPEAETTTAED